MRILIGTDLSKRSQAALTRAVRLSAGAQAHLTLVHVVDSDLPTDLVEAQRTRAQQWLAAHPFPSATTGTEAPPIDVLVRTGDPHVELLAAARELPADLIVLGAHRRRLLRDAFMGTTAERLLRVSTRPVLIVHSDNPEPYRQLLATTDLSEASAGALTTARDLGFLTAQAVLLHVFHAAAKGKLQQVGVDPLSHVEAERTRAAQAVDAFLSTTGLTALRPRVQLREGRAAHEIRTLVSELEPDLLVLGTKGLTGIRQATLGSVTESLMRTVPCDVLAVPPSPEAATPN